MIWKLIVVSSVLFVEVNDRLHYNHILQTLHVFMYLLSKIYRLNFTKIKDVAVCALRRLQYLIIRSKLIEHFTLLMFHQTNGKYWTIAYKSMYLLNDNKKWKLQFKKEKISKNLQ